MPLTSFIYSRQTTINSKCPKISYTNLSEKVACANSVDHDQAPLSGTVWSESTLFAFSQNILWNKCIKNKI